MSEHKNGGLDWGPQNPHPLSRMKSELVWEGKYDEYGNRRPVKLPTTPLPLQRIEAIDEPRDREKSRQFDMFDEMAFARKAHQDDFRNLLIWGDNKIAIASLLEQFRGKIHLIYIDPPFDVGADFTLDVQVGDGQLAVGKEQSILEAVAYRDIWGRGTDSYLHFLSERLTLIRALLSESGSIFVHIGSNLSHICKLLLDDVFGRENFRNEIVLPGRAVKNLQQQFDSVSKLQVRHDALLWYSKSPSHRVSLPWVAKHGPGNPEGHWHHFWSTADRPTMRYELFGVAPQTGQWVWKEERALAAAANHERYLREAGGRTMAQYWRDTGCVLEFVRPDPQDGKPLYWRAPAEMRVADSVWSGVPIYSAATGFPTEKNERLVEEILGLASPQQGDLVADFFCGSGTTLAVAEKLGRCWIGVDLGRYAIHTSRKRLIQVQRELHTAGKPYRSFDVYNLGRYERQWWQLERLQGANTEHRAIVLQFYKAAPLKGTAHPLLHGTKTGAYVHIDEIDGIFTFDELRAAATAAQAAGARELHCLAWEFEMELALKKQAIEAETGFKIRLKYIPREMMEANRTECQFFEAGYLEAKTIKHDAKVDVELVHFTPALAEAPESEIAALRERAVKSPFDFIDFWAVDFTWDDGKPFEHHWQDFRTRKDRALKTKTDIGWQYETKGNHRICVKVIDVFGVDTTTTIEVEV